MVHNSYFNLISSSLQREIRRKNMSKSTSPPHLQSSSNYWLWVLPPYCVDEPHSDVPLQVFRWVTKETPGQVQIYSDEWSFKTICGTPAHPKVLFTYSNIYAHHKMADLGLRMWLQREQWDQQKWLFNLICILFVHVSYTTNADERFRQH